MSLPILLAAAALSFAAAAPASASDTTYTSPYRGNAFDMEHKAAAYVEEPGSPVPLDRLGWMSSRFLTAAPTPWYQADE